MNVVTTVIKSRHSVRKFRPDPVNEMAIRDALECALQAPTARNVQPWLIGVVRNKETLQKIADLAANGTFVRDCAVCFTVFGEKQETYYLEDCCAATENLILSLQAYGIGSCWVAGDKKPYCDAVRLLLAVTQQYTLVSLVAAGYPAEITVAQKKPIKNLVFQEGFTAE
jgi:nitroreductase